MQLDCETDGRTKLQELGKFGFHFLNNDYQSTCNWSSVQNARYLMERGKIETKMTGLSRGRATFTVYWKITDFLLSVPIFGDLLKPYLPMLGYFCLITLWMWWNNKRSMQALFYLAALLIFETGFQSQSVLTPFYSIFSWKKFSKLQKLHHYQISNCYMTLFYVSVCNFEYLCTFIVLKPPFQRALIKHKYPWLGG